MTRAMLKSSCEVDQTIRMMKWMLNMYAMKQAALRQAKRLLEARTPEPPPND